MKEQIPKKKAPKRSGQYLLLSLVHIPQADPGDVLHADTEVTRCACETLMPPKRFLFFFFFLRNEPFADDLDLCTNKCLLMRCAIIPDMSLVNKLI